MQALAAERSPGNITDQYRAFAKSIVFLYSNLEISFYAETV
jgi:hypothetical protein